MLADAGDLPRAMDELGLPLVVKIPDGSFSRGVHKVRHAGGVPPHRRRAVRGDRPPAGAEVPADRVRLARRRARRRAAVRLPVPHGARPLADRQAPARRLRARGRLSHLRSRPGAAARSSTSRCARRSPIGDGFYGVDIKETDDGFIVMEVNDNPNLEHGIEDQVGKDEIWIRAAQVVRRTVRAVGFPQSSAISVRGKPGLALRGVACRLWH